MPQIDDLRQWRQSAVESHLYSTAELVGDKVLAMTNHPDDAYWLAQCYYGMGEYLRGAELILKNYFETESLKCRYIAALCYINALELDKAMELLDLDTITNEFDEPMASPYPNSAHSPVLGNFSTHQSGNNPNRSPFLKPSAPSPVVLGSSTPGLGSLPNRKIRSVRTSSLKVPNSNGNRTISGSSRVSLILPELEDDSLPATEINGINVVALLKFLKGKIYTLQAKFTLAKECYIDSLKCDARCFESFNMLITYHSLLPKEEWALLQQLDFSKIGTEFGSCIYALRLSKLSNKPDLMDAVEILKETYQVDDDSCDISLARAEHYFNDGRYADAKVLFEEALNADQYCLRIYPSYVSTLYEMKDYKELYKVAYSLSDMLNSHPVASHAIGMYYMANKRISEARHYFSEASLADPGFVPAWLGFARTFVIESEHEQAITAYTTVSRLFPGFYLSYLCIGMQHLELMNVGVAEKYLLTARQMHPEDPYLLNELGVCHYKQGRFHKALTILELAGSLALRNNGSDEIKTSIDINMAIVLTKLNQLPQAIELFEKSSLSTKLDANTLAAMGLCYIKNGHTDTAITKLTAALTINQSDPVITDLLKYALQQNAKSFSVNSFVEENQKYIKRERMKRMTVDANINEKESHE